jgi:hypothetical protein
MHLDSTEALPAPAWAAFAGAALGYQMVNDYSRQ